MSNSKTCWLFLGQAIFGLLIGFMVGLSINPVVSTVLGLLFAFIGGSIIVLIKGRSEAELAMIGKSITALSIFMFLGVVFGITFRVNNLLLFTSAEKNRFNFNISLSVDDIKRLGKKSDYSTLLCSIVKSAASGKAIEINKQDLDGLISAQIDPVIIHAMLNNKTNCFYKHDSLLSNQGVKPFDESQRRDKDNSINTQLYNDSIFK